jgi:hypothetical protein
MLLFFEDKLYQETLGAVFYLSRSYFTFLQYFNRFSSTIKILRNASQGRVAVFDAYYRNYHAAG